MTLSIIDFHSHYVDPHWPLSADHQATGSERERWNRINRQLTSREALLQDVESGDLAARIINTPTALFSPLTGRRAPDTWQRINDDIAVLTAEHPGRLHALASVDAFAGDSAARELTRAVRDLGLRGVFVESAKGTSLLDAPEARPTLQVAAELGVPVFAHPINPRPLSRQLAPYGRLGTLLARGTVNAATLIALLESGVFDELPKLQVVVTTLAIGGVLLAGGFGDASGVRTDAASLLRRNVYIDTMNFNPVLIRAAVDLLGADHVLAGSDWPIVSEGPIRQRAEQAFAAAALTPAEQTLIAAGNTKRLLRI
ncbi:MAG: amidohydrolase family protein [Rhodopila sp.]|jgi:aminocarboxymuconate-semialdehyde decarboxylase